MTSFRTTPVTLIGPVPATLLIVNKRDCLNKTHPTVHSTLRTVWSSVRPTWTLYGSVCCIVA